MRLANQRIVVAGGSSGMGLAAAELSLKEDAHVVLVGRNEERLSQAAATLGCRGRVQTIAADVTREEDVARLFESTGPIDHLVVTAASNLAYPPIEQLDMAAARAAIEVKLVAALLLAKYAAKSLKEGGSIVFTAGIAAERPLATGAVVASVNGALFSLAYGLAIALAPRRVNTISPGWVDTPIWEAFGSRKDAMIAQMSERLPVRRIGRPADIAHAIVFLMENEFTTGSVLHVDGGQRLV
jgi:NAD(P)-dependent dehydrogenase (short-subunit alcohol dehydrogenase family)